MKRRRMTRSTRIALVTLALGFLVEGATEAYQFFANGYLSRAWAGLYYIGIGTTVVGFYLIYRGRSEWTESHRRLVTHGHRALWVALALFCGSAAVLAITALALRVPDRAPLWAEVLVGGGVALSFGNFFLGLLLIVYRLAGRIGRYLGIAAYGWALGVAVLTGWIVAQQFLSLLTEFFTDPLALFASFAPLAFAMAPLFVTYFLLAVVYWDAYRHLRHPGGAEVPPLPALGRSPVQEWTPQGDERHREAGGGASTPGQSTREATPSGASAAPGSRP